MLHPIGSCIILSDTIDPNALFDGTVWELIGQDKCIIGAGNKFTAMQDIPAGLPNITGSALNIVRYEGAGSMLTDGAIDVESGNGVKLSSAEYQNCLSRKLVLNASQSNFIYGASDTVQPPSIALFIWRRTA